MKAVTCMACENVRTDFGPKLFFNSLITDFFFLCAINLKFLYETFAGLLLNYSLPLSPPLSLVPPPPYYSPSEFSMRNIIFSKPCLQLVQHENESRFEKINVLFRASFSSENNTEIKFPDKSRLGIWPNGPIKNLEMRIFLSYFIFIFFFK